MEWYDDFATDALGSFAAFGSAYGVYRGIEYLINNLPESMIHPQGSRSLVESLSAGGAEVIGALATWLGVVYLTQIASDKELFYRARTWCAQGIRSYKEKVAAKGKKRAIEERIKDIEREAEKHLSAGVLEGRAKQKERDERHVQG